MSKRIVIVSGGKLEENFAHPPAAARPWVYWMWMDGNLSREGLTADLEAMQRAGILSHHRIHAGHRTLWRTILRYANKNRLG